LLFTPVPLGGLVLQRRNFDQRRLAISDSVPVREVVTSGGVFDVLPRVPRGTLISYSEISYSEISYSEISYSEISYSAISCSDPPRTR
jgi:hypothetical protein